MSLAEDYNQRVISNFEGLAVSIIAGAFALVGEALAESPTTPDDTSVNALFTFIQAYPALITLAGFLFVVAAAGPFGFFGFIFELVGLRLLFIDPVAGLIFILIGAGLIVIGAKFWRWVPVIDWFFSNRRRGGGRGGYRRRW
ncbi:hypothetical protein ACLI4R_17555 [Natrialbaceae archaeon A-chndr2]